jgi:mRNA interferase MazF
MKRGEVWWVDFEPTRGSEIRKRRPAVIITDDDINRVRRTLVVIPLSSSPNPIPPIVVALPSAGEGSVAVCDQLRAVDKSRLSKKIGDLKDAELRNLEKSVRQILSL